MGSDYDAGAGSSRLNHVVPALCRDAPAHEDNIGQGIDRAQLANSVEQDCLAILIFLTRKIRTTHPGQARVTKESRNLRESLGMPRRDKQSNPPSLSSACVFEGVQNDALFGFVRRCRYDQ